MATLQEIEELISFLPKLYAEGFVPMKWEGGERSEVGIVTLPNLEYDDTVSEFIRVASRECWCDYNYDPEEARKMLDDHDFINSATLGQVKTMLTYCIRGERFCDGFIGRMIEEGYIHRLLQRIEDLNCM